MRAVEADQGGIVVPALDPNALLRVDDSPRGGGGPAEEHPLELVHAGVDEGEGRVPVREDRTRRYQQVVVVPLEVVCDRKKATEEEKKRRN